MATETLDNPLQLSPIFCICRVLATEEKEWEMHTKYPLWRVDEAQWLDKVDANNRLFELW